MIWMCKVNERGAFWFKKKSGCWRRCNLQLFRWLIGLCNPQWPGGFSVSQDSLSYPLELSVPWLGPKLVEKRFMGVENKKILEEVESDIHPNNISVRWSATEQILFGSFFVVQSHKYCLLGELNSEYVWTICVRLCGMCATYSETGHFTSAFMSAQLMLLKLCGRVTDLWISILWLQYASPKFDIIINSYYLMHKATDHYFSFLTYMTDLYPCMVCLLIVLCSFM